MSAEAALERGRAAALLLMVDTCTVTRVTGRTTNTTTGAVTDVVSNLYSGACRFQQARGAERREDAGQDRVSLIDIDVQLPMSVTGLKVGDVVTAVTSAHDADLPGRVFRIQVLAHKTHATSRRVQCVEVAGS
jgi:hypothetical protein